MSVENLFQTGNVICGKNFLIELYAADGSGKAIAGTAVMGGTDHNGSFVDFGHRTRNRSAAQFAIKIDRHFFAVKNDRAVIPGIAFDGQFSGIAFG